MRGVGLETGGWTRRGGVAIVAAALVLAFAVVDTGRTSAASARSGLAPGWSRPVAAGRVDDVLSGPDGFPNYFGMRPDGTSVVVFTRCLKHSDTEGESVGELVISSFTRTGAASSLDVGRTQCDAADVQAAMDNSGQLLVAWESPGQNDQPIFTRMLTSNGRLSAPQQVGVGQLGPIGIGASGAGAVTALTQGLPVAPYLYPGPSVTLYRITRLGQVGPAIPLCVGGLAQAPECAFLESFSGGGWLPSVGIDRSGDVMVAYYVGKGEVVQSLPAAAVSPQPSVQLPAGERFTQVVVEPNGSTLLLANRASRHGFQPELYVLPANGALGPARFPVGFQRDEYTDSQSIAVGVGTGTDGLAPLDNGSAIFYVMSTQSISTLSERSVAAASFGPLRQVASQKRTFAAEGVPHEVVPAGNHALAAWVSLISPSGGGLSWDIRTITSAGSLGPVHQITSAPMYELVAVAGNGSGQVAVLLSGRSGVVITTSRFR
jgi:hypothetical protein